MSYTFQHVEQLIQNEDKLSIFHCNARSLRKNFNSLVGHISQHVPGFDVIAVSETWLQNNETIVMHGYNLLSLPRDAHTRGGGVALFVKENIVFQVLSPASVSDDVIEALFVKLDCGVIVGVVYRPPGLLVKSFLEKFEAVLTELTNGRSDRIVVVGDFNIDLAGDAQKAIRCF